MAKKKAARKRARKIATTSKSTSRTKDGKTVAAESDIEKKPVTLENCDNPAYVKVSGGLTKSLGDGTFEFVRVDVSISMPCLPDEDSIDECYRSTAERVDEYLDEELRAAMP